MANPSPDKKRHLQFDFDEAGKTPLPERQNTLNDVPAETVRKITSVLRQTSGRLPAVPPAPKKPDTDIEVRFENAPKKAAPMPRVVVATSIPLRKRIAQSFFRKVLNIPELEIEMVGSLDEIANFPNPEGLNYALIDGEMQFWETIQMFIQQRAPECKIKISKNFAMDFKNFSA